MHTKKDGRQLGLLSIESLYKEYHPKILVFFLKKGLDQDAAEDLTQEVFFRLLRSKKNLDGEDYVRNLIYRIASNLAIDYFRKNNGSVQVRTFSRENLSEESHPSLVERSSDPEEQIITGETSGDVQSVISNLPERYAEAIFLKEYEGLSYREMAKRMGVSEKAVESLLHRARVQLKGDLHDVGEKRGGWWSGILLGLRGVLGKVQRRTSSPWKWISRRLHRISIGTGSIGAGKAVFNLVMATLIVGTVVGSGVTISVFACAKPAEDGVERAVNAAEILDQRVEVLADSEIENFAPKLQDPLIELEPLSVSPVSEEQGEEEAVVERPSIVQPLSDVLTMTGDTTRNLLHSTGDTLDVLLVGVADLLNGVVDPLLNVLSLLGIPSGVIAPIDELLELNDVRELAGDLVDVAVETTYVIDDAAVLLSDLELVDGTVDTLLTLPDTVIPNPTPPASSQQEEVKNETVEPDVAEMEEQAEPITPPSDDEVSNTSDETTAPEEESKEDEGNGPIDVLVDLLDDLLPF